MMPRTPSFSTSDDVAEEWAGLDPLLRVPVTPGPHEPLAIEESVLGGGRADRDDLNAQIESEFLSTLWGDQRQRGHCGMARPPAAHAWSSDTAEGKECQRRQAIPYSGPRAEEELEEAYWRESTSFGKLFARLKDAEAQMAICRASNRETVQEAESALAQLVSEDQQSRTIVEACHDEATKVAGEVNRFFQEELRMAGVKPGSHSEGHGLARGFSELLGVYEGLMGEHQKEMDACESLEMAVGGAVGPSWALGEVRSVGLSTQEVTSRILGQTAESLEAVRSALHRRHGMERLLAALGMEARGLQQSLYEAIDESTVAEQDVHGRLEDLCEQLLDLEHSEEELQAAIASGCLEDPGPPPAVAAQSEVDLERQAMEAERQYLAKAFDELWRLLADLQEGRAEASAAAEATRTEVAALEATEATESQAFAVELRMKRDLGAPADKLEVDHALATRKLLEEGHKWQERIEGTAETLSDTEGELSALCKTLGHTSAASLRSVLLSKRAEINSVRDNEVVEREEERLIHHELESILCKQRQEEEVRAQQGDLRHRVYAQETVQLQGQISSAEAAVHEVEATRDALVRGLQLDLQTALASQEAATSERLVQAGRTAAQVVALEAEIQGARGKEQDFVLRGQQEVAGLELRKSRADTESEGIISGFEGELEVMSHGLEASPAKIYERAARALHSLPYGRAAAASSLQGGVLRGESACLRALESAAWLEGTYLDELRDEVHDIKVRTAAEQRQLEDKEEAYKNKWSVACLEHDRLIGELHHSGQRAQSLASARAELARLETQRDAENGACKVMQREVLAFQEDAEDAARELEHFKARMVADMNRLHATQEWQAKVHRADQELRAMHHEVQEASTAGEIELEEEHHLIREAELKLANESRTAVRVSLAEKLEEDAEATAVDQLAATEADMATQAMLDENQAEGLVAELENLRIESTAGIREVAELEAKHQLAETKLLHIEQRGEKRLSGMDRAWLAHVAALRASAAERDAEQKLTSTQAAAHLAQEMRGARRAIESTEKTLQNEIAEQAAQVRAEDTYLEAETRHWKTKEFALEEELGETEAELQLQLSAQMPAEAAVLGEISNLQEQLVILEASMEEQVQKSHAERELELEVELGVVMANTEARVEQEEHNWASDLELLRSEMLDLGAGLLPLLARPALPSHRLPSAEQAHLLCDDCCGAILALTRYCQHEAEVELSASIRSRDIENRERSTPRVEFRNEDGRMPTRVPSVLLRDAHEDRSQLDEFRVETAYNNLSDELAQLAAEARDFQRRHHGLTRVLQQVLHRTGMG